LDAWLLAVENGAMTITPTHRSAQRPTPMRLLATVRDDLRERRQARTAQRTLREELATYTTTAEIDDLLGSVRGQEGPDADQIRDILTRNLQDRRLAS
jgi:hypothetical protein